MALRDRAVQAHLADEQSYRDRARQALIDLGVIQADNLTLADQDVVDGKVRILYTDGDLHLAVILDDTTARVLLVRQVDGQWTRVAEVTTLAELGGHLT